MNRDKETDNICGTYGRGRGIMDWSGLPCHGMSLGVEQCDEQ